MGSYSEYLDRHFDFQGLTVERKNQLKRISEIRGRDVLVYAADLNKPGPTSIDYTDLLPVTDQLANLSGGPLDVLLETPGGSGEVAEDIVRLLRGASTELGFIVPGYAKSAGTIIVMAGDEIVMGAASALGPIDAQLNYQGKSFSAEALLEGVKKIKAEVEQTGNLNRTYIPILQGISPGELERAQNALDFAKILVRQWLAEYKFRNWDTHSSTGQRVTEDEKRQRAGKIAEQLCSHSKWLTHGRSIKIEDLRAMRLVITDYRDKPELSEAIQRYYTLLRMTFENTNMYKLVETPTSQIYRFSNPQANPTATPIGGPPGPQNATKAAIRVNCPKCQTESELQLNLGVAHPLEPGKHPFPADNKFKCPSCSAEIDLTGARQQIESQAKKPVVTDYTGGT